MRRMKSIDVPGKRGRYHFWVLLLSALLLPGCSASEQRPDDQTSSPGVEVVANPGERSRLRLVEDLRIGRAEGLPELEFHRIRAVALGQNGSIYVADGGTGQIRAFQSDGAYLGAFGRRGDGPGEFQFVVELFFQGDTLVVFDGRPRRGTRLTSDLAMVGTWSTLSESGIWGPIGFGAGRFISRDVRLSNGWRYEVGVPLRDTVRIVSSVEPPGRDTEGTLVVEYVTGRTFGIDSEMAMTAASPLWEPTPRHRVDGHGRVFVHRGLEYAVDVYSPDAVHLRRITREHAPVPVSNDHVDRYRDLATRYWQTDSLHYGEWLIARAADVGRADLPRESSLPALGELLVGADGAFWVERPDRAEDPVLLEWPRAGSQSSFWDVFDADGHVQGTAEIDPRFSPLAVTERSVVGVWRDEFGVESVVRFSVDPT